MKTIREQQRNRALGAKVRDIRRSQNMTQEHLAKRMGMARRTIQMYEQGSLGMSVAKLEQVAGILQVPVTDILGYR